MIRLLQLVCLLVASAESSKLIVLNHATDAVQLTLTSDNDPEHQQVSVNAQSTQIIDVGPTQTSFGENASLKLSTSPPFQANLPVGTQRYAVLVIDTTTTLFDTNDLQVELSYAAHKCVDYNDDSGTYNLSFDCVASFVFGGGLESSFLSQAFTKLWTNVEFWALCNYIEAAAPIRQLQILNKYTVDILVESPKVAAIRNFISTETCQELMTKHANIKDLVMARVGGEGTTSTSESRETLTRNFEINWNENNALSQTAVATFDVASELLGSPIPYEGQEPINFLHYEKGYEYKPHTDGMGYETGDRVATTLIYCQVADEGGGTAFPKGNPPFWFQPENAGDLIYFEYQPSPYMAEHAACPVISGTKSTFTQWHRLGVSPETPWWNFENWGEFHNPYLGTRWKGPRYGKEEAEL